MDEILGQHEQDPGFDFTVVSNVANLRILLMDAISTFSSPLTRALTLPPHPADLANSNSRS